MNTEVQEEQIYKPKRSPNQDKIARIMSNELPDASDEERNRLIYSSFDKNYIIYQDRTTDEFTIIDRSTNAQLDEINLSIWIRKKNYIHTSIAPKSSNLESINFIRDLDCDARKISVEQHKIIKLSPSKIAELCNGLQQKRYLELDSMTEDQLIDRMHEIFADYEIHKQWLNHNRIKVLDKAKAKQHEDYVKERTNKVNKSDKSNSTIIKRAKIELDPMFEKYKDDKQRIKFFNAMSWKLSDPAKHEQYENEVLGIIK